MYKYLATIDSSKKINIGTLFSYFKLDFYIFLFSYFYGNFVAALIVA